MENSLRDQILNSYKYGGKPQYMEALLTSVPLDGLYQEIADLLHSDLNSEFAETCFFIQDVVMSTHTAIADQFRAGVYTSPVVFTLESLVKDAPQYHTRSMATYTLGKIWSVNSVGVMVDAFYRYFETDPLLVPRLMFEIGWLQQETATLVQLACLEAAATSWNYLTRWAVVHMIDRMTDREITSPRVSQILDMLIQDDMAVIRAEAQFFLFKLGILSRIYNEGVTKKERRAMRKQINQAEPTLTFENLTLQFQSPLRGGNSYDYHLMELMRFADNLIANQ